MVGLLDSVTYWKHMILSLLLLSPPLTLVKYDPRYMSAVAIYVWSTLCSQTWSLFGEVMVLLLNISPSWSEISKCEVPYLCPQCRLQVHLILWHISFVLYYISSAIEWHQRDREVFQHNSAVLCHTCWMSVSSSCIFSTSMYCPYSHSWCILLHLCWMPESEVYKKEKTFKNMTYLTYCMNVLSTCSR